MGCDFITQMACDLAWKQRLNSGSIQPFLECFLKAGLAVVIVTPRTELQRSVPVDKPIEVVIAQSTDDVIVLKTDALSLPKPSTKDVVQRSPPLLRKCCWALMCHPHTAKQDWTTSIITTICNPRAEERRCICPQRFVGPTDSELYCTSILVVHSCGGALMWLEPQ